MAKATLKLKLQALDVYPDPETMSWYPVNNKNNNKLPKEAMAAAASSQLGGNGG